MHLQGEVLEGLSVSAHVIFPATHPCLHKDCQEGSLGPTDPITSYQTGGARDLDVSLGQSVTHRDPNSGVMTASYTLKGRLGSSRYVLTP